MQKQAKDQELNLTAEATIWIFSCRSDKGAPPIGQRKRTKFNNKKHQSGQIVLEYILLLFISVGAATLLTKKLVSRNAESGGVITTAWAKTIDAIGADLTD